MKKQNIRLNKIPFSRVEKFRESFEFNVCEISELLGFTTRQYSRCKNEGFIPAYRYFAMKNAILINVLQENSRKLEVLSQM